MNNEEIKSEKEKCFAQIESANNRLAEIRKICKHEKTFEGNWSWRIGSYQPAEICEYCGNLIRYIGMPDTIESRYQQKSDNNEGSVE